MNLYDIKQEILALVDDETGEIVDFERFESLQIDLAEKRENIALYIKNLKSEATAIKAEEDNLKRRREAALNKAERLSDYLQRDLSGENFSTPRCQISYRKSNAIDVENAVLAAEWLENHGYSDAIKYSDPQISKADIKPILSAGAEIPGIAFVTRENIQIK